MAWSTVFSVLGVPYLTMMPVIARDRLGLGAGGLRRAARLRRHRRAHRARCRSPRSAIGFGAGRVLFDRRVLVRRRCSSLFSLVRSARAGLPDAVLRRVRDDRDATRVGNATLQHLVPNELRGRMMAAYSFIAVGLSSVARLAHRAGASRT